MRKWLCALAACALIPTAVSAQSTLSADERLAREIFAELVEIDTSPMQGTTRAAQAMAARLRAAGITDVQVIGPREDVRRHNMVARLKGTGAREPLLLLAHLDVVTALREDWSMDPFRFIERDGYYYGRGTLDDKAQAAIFVTNLIRMKRDGILPDRDIILALTADEEGGDYNGVAWLLEERPELISAAYAINEGGGGHIRDGRRLLNAVQASEKLYQSFALEVRSTGGYSAQTGPDNGTVTLTDALTRIEQYRFPAVLNEVTRAYFTRMAQLERGQAASDMRSAASPQPDSMALDRLSRDPFFNTMLRTTCTPAMLEGGHTQNAAPHAARAVVNCRIIPGQEPAAVLAALRSVVADDRIGISAIGQATPSPPSPLKREVLEPIERITTDLWPGVPVVPIMSASATDALYLRRAGIPVYGVSGIFRDIEDDRWHGRDERISVDAFFEGLEFLHRLVRELSGTVTE